MPETRVIDATIFDMDGTLVQTERLKARSYAEAASELRPEVTEEQVVEAFRDVVGRSRREVSTTLLERFALEEAASRRMEEFGVSRPWQAYTQLRLRIQDALLSDPDVLRDHQWSHTDPLLRTVNERGCGVALATMSHCEDTTRILDVLGLRDRFSFVATRDDVDRPKPDPEIYHLVFREIGRDPEECLIIEDSPAGVEAAVRSGARVVALGTPFTLDHHLEHDTIPNDRVARSPEELCRLVGRVLDGEM